ncbi:MAG TPA: glycosyl hydrolase family 28-related protein, partial [Bacteroidia bacterium]|nr:glycosyl hydrolase family 28-related protein [Bacteroidia bacterium]
MQTLKKKIISVLFLVLLYGAACAQVIPDSLRAEWSYAGLQNFYVDTNNVADVTTFGATGNGTTNDYPAVLAAINSLSGNSGIVYFPPGNYLLNSTINLPDSVVLKGASSAQTTLTFNFGGATGNCINVQASQPHPFYPVQSGYGKDSFRILCDSAMNFAAGDYAELRQQNGAWDTNPASWADYSVGQMLKVTGIDGDTIFLEHALRIDYDSGLNVEIRRVNMRSNVSVQCMHIVRTDSTAPSVNYGIYFYYAANCLVRGVELEHTIGSLIAAEFSTALEITGSYFHHAYDYSGTSTKGYGVTVASHTGESKIENNIFRHLRHAMSVKQGANGNVYSYNYSIEPTRTEFPTDLGGDISLHGHYAFSNLFEGNICQNLMIDQAWGPSGPFNTFFRNR